MGEKFKKYIKELLTSTLSADLLIRKKIHKTVATGQAVLAFIEVSSHCFNYVNQLLKLFKTIKSLPKIIGLLLQ